MQSGATKSTVVDREFDCSLISGEKLSFYRTGCVVQTGTGPVQTVMVQKVQQSEEAAVLGAVSSPGLEGAAVSHHSEL